MESNMRILRICTLLAAGAVLLLSCNNSPDTASVGESIITGTILDFSTGNPIPSVTIVAQSSLGTKSTVTDTLGVFRLTYTLDSSATVVLTTTKTGYRDTILSVLIRSGVSVPLILQLSPRSPVIGPGGGSGSSSGLAQTIAFLGADPQDISVYGVGGLETSVLGWEVRDSLGLPIDAAHATTLSFSINGGVNGGEYISPPQVTTNGNGQAYTTLNSGIRSGVLQIVATTTVGSRTITSSPVRAVVHAGFPDQVHFTIAAQMFNFPTLGVLNNRDQVTVLVGDIYSNPVQPSTAIYFRSSAGVIVASAFTNADGLGTVDLISGQPQPFGTHAAGGQGDGYHYVVANTIGQGGTIVTDSVLLLWSGRSLITNVNPTLFDIPNGGSQAFTFTVSDLLGHPLAAGTRISVVGEVPPPPDPNTPVNQVSVSFGIQGAITLEDDIFPGPGRTDFGFNLSDGTTNINNATPVSLGIAVQGPNGVANFTISGTVH
jgi:hypothetical protein